MSWAVVEAVAARLETVMPADVTVHRGGVTDGEVGRFVVVRSNNGTRESQDLADTRSRRDVTVWVTYVSTDKARDAAAREVMWLAEKGQAVLNGWRMDAASWKPVPLTSQPVQRDEDYPDRVVMYAVDQYGISYQPGVAA